MPLATVAESSDAALLPCSICPWRKGRDATTIPRYDHAKAVGLLNTVGPDDAMRPIMACHGSGEGSERPCLGYLARAGWSNLNVRLAVIRGLMADPWAVADACERHGVGLERDYPAVLRKLARSLRPGRKRKAVDTKH